MSLKKKTKIIWHFYVLHIKFYTMYTHSETPEVLSRVIFCTLEREPLSHFNLFFSFKVLCILARCTHARNSGLEIVERYL